MLNVDRIKHHKNIYYIDYTIPFDTAGANPPTNPFIIGFPLGALNIKANNALISFDKVVFQSVDAEDEDFHPITIRTNIPTANCMSGQLEGTDVHRTNYPDPKTVGFGECISFPHVFYNSSTDQYQQAVYQNNNPDRAVLCANPMGSTYTVNVYKNNATTGIGALATLTGNLIFTLRVELLEETIIK